MSSPKQRLTDAAGKEGGKQTPFFLTLRKKQIRFGGGFIILSEIPANNEWATHFSIDGNERNRVNGHYFNTLAGAETDFNERT